MAEFFFVFGDVAPADKTLTPANRNVASHVTADSSATAHVYVHSAYWPYQRLATLAAHSISRAFQWMDFGRCTFDIPRNDPALSAAPGCLQRGAWIVIESVSCRPWVGLVRVLTEGTSGLINAECVEASAILDVKISKQQAQFVGASGWCFQRLMQDLNGKGHTGLYYPAVVEPGPRVVIDLAGQTILNALKELADRTGYEWWLEVDVSPAYIHAQIRWGYRQGQDVASMVKLYEGTHFHDLTYILDTTGLRQSVTVYGGVGSLSERETITRAATHTPRSNELGVALEPASELYDRSLDVPPSMRSEDVYFRLLTSDRTELSGEAQRAMERGIGISERYRLTGSSALSLLTIGPGDFVQLLTQSTGLGALNRKVRITGIQPDEESGLPTISVETPLK